MEIKHIKIQHFRGIESLDLTFQAGVNVLIGVNGVGKSSILDCLGCLCSQISPPFRIAVLNNDVIKLGHTQTSMAVSMAFEHLQEGHWSWKLHKDSALFPGGNAVEADDIFVKDFTQALRLKFQDDPTTSVPLVAYYPAHRKIPTVVALENPQHSNTFSTLNQQTLENRQIDFSEFFNWFKQSEDLENEHRLEGQPTYRDRQLEAVRNAIPKFLPGFSHLRVRRTNLSITVTKHGQELAINQLSDGEKSLLTLVADIARRLAIHHPGLADPLQGTGVILIDEIDAHLHPQWQRRIIPSLREAFPNCQFILATHSPLIISDVPAENIHLLSQIDGNVTASHPDISFGRDANQILELVMGVPDRPEKYKRELRSLFRLIDDGNLTGARQLKEQIEHEIGFDEPEFAKADVMIRRKEILGR
jgi:predicted ATP-binding protein involved in virulence